MRSSLKALEGVRDVEVDLDEKIAIVVYEIAKVEVLALTQATTNVGFPSSVRTSQATDLN